MYINIPLLSSATCNKYLYGVMKAGMLCAGYVEGGRDACQVIICNKFLKNEPRNIQRVIIYRVIQVVV